MCYLIITLRSLLWTVISIGIVAMHVLALISPDWLLRDDRPPATTYAYTSTTPQDPSPNATGPVRQDSDVRIAQTSMLGLLTLCRESYSVSTQLRVTLESNRGVAELEECTWIKSFFDLPIWLWMVTVVLYCLGLVILGFIAVVSIFTFCFRSICRKSLFTVSGLIQAIAGKKNTGV